MNKFILIKSKIKSDKMSTDKNSSQNIDSLNSNPDEHDVAKAKETLKNKFQSYFSYNFIKIDILLNYLWVVEKNSVLILFVLAVLVFYDILIYLDSEKYLAKEDAIQKAIKLVQSQQPIEICGKSLPIPQSIHKETILLAAKEFIGKKGPVTKSQELILNQFQNVFGNNIALGLSFRKNTGKIGPDFLRENPDFDFEAIDLLIDLCKKNDTFHQRILKTLVFS